MTKKLDIAAIATHVGSGYPAPFAAAVAKRERKRLAQAAGLTKIGVTLLRLPPGTWSTQRHWHDHSDEFVFVVSGEVVLVTDEGEEILRAGDSAGFRAGDPNGHHLQNRGAEDAVILEIGNHLETDTAHYPDIDLVAALVDGTSQITHRDGTPYPARPRSA
ncbi:MAG TPA: cupin domain-containing protein [Rhizomicrobium sp.]|jgi:uncharacterized cupin superfamily protein|nr:cupin domain-containing protein [Rhizomicrobium sp.]